MKREVRWERMFPHELEAAFEECPIVYFCYGLCEPHGPQNAVGLDALKAHAIACRTAREHGGIVAPPDYWHIHEHGGYALWANRTVGEIRPWLTAMPAWMHFKNICYHVRAADAMGFHAAILLTGHYGPNWKDLKTLLEILQPHFDMQLYGLPDFEANQPGFDSDGNSGGDHAGKVETSLLWALEPGLRRCLAPTSVGRTGTPTLLWDQPHMNPIAKSVNEWSPMKSGGSVRKQRNCSIPIPNHRQNVNPSPSIRLKRSGNAMFVHN